jgi:hypothetical protein
MICWSALDQQRAVISSAARAASNALITGTLADTSPKIQTLAPRLERRCAHGLAGTSELSFATPGAHDTASE